MAKKKQSTLAVAEHKIEEFAEDLGKMLGHARTKAQGWLGQREAIVKSLTELRDEASKLLGQLGHTVAEVPFPRSRRGRPVGSKNKAAAVGGDRGNGKKPRRKMSKAARAKISAAQKARWAKQKAGEKK